MPLKTLREQFDEYRAKKNLRTLSQESLQWFYQNTKAMGGRPDFNASASLGKATTRPIPGKFYLYKYDPKTKDKLPVYDTLPVILVTDVTDRGWYGINFHYMPMEVRLAIMEVLFKNISDKTRTDRFKFLMNWKIASAVARKVSANDHLNQSIKQYLRSQLQSPLIEIEPKNWPMVIFLPISRFRKGRR